MLLRFEITLLVLYESTFTRHPGYQCAASVDKLDVAGDYPWLPPDTIKARDIERFRRFSDGFIARNPDNHLMIMDVGYSLVPSQLSPLWLIRLKPEEPWQHSDYLNTRDQTSRSRQRFLEMLF